MSALRNYLPRKRGALMTRQAVLEADPSAAVAKLSAVCLAGDNTGVRTVWVRDQHKVLSDSAPGLGGYDLGPSAPELMLTALASCIVHTYLLQAAKRDLVLDEVEVTVEADLDIRAVLDLPGDAPRKPYDWKYRARVKSPEPVEKLQALTAEVERACPLLHALRTPTPVTGSAKYES